MKLPPKLRLAERMWIFGPISQFLGVLTEYYDITILAVALPILTKVFLPPTMPPIISTFYIVTGIAASWITRPIGAVIWGHYSDRIGRRVLMIASMAGMAIVTALVAVLPTYAEAGFLGLTLLIIIRILVGVFYGGEKAAGVTYSQEFTPAKWRGFAGGLGQAGVGFGVALSGMATGVFFAYYGNDAMVAYAWRYVFLSGLIPFVVVAFIRLATVESPIWKAAKSEGKLERTPIASLLKGGTKSRFLQSTFMTVGFIMVGATGTSYIAPILINAPSRLSLSQELIAYNVYAVATIAVAFVIGSLSQYVGRKRMLIIIAIASIITWVPTNYGIVMFGSSLNLIPVMFLAVWYAFLDHGTFSVMDPYLTERFGTSHRASGTGISYALGSMVGGICAAALVPVLHAALAGIETSTSVWLTVGIIGVAGSLIGLIGVYIGPETVGTKLEEIESEPSSNTPNHK